MPWNDSKDARTGSGAGKPKIHSIAALPRGRDFGGSFNLASATYTFRYTPSSAEIAEHKLRLLGGLTITDPRGRPHSQDRVRAVLAATQGGAGAGPSRRQIGAAGADRRAQAIQQPRVGGSGETRSLPRTDNTGSTSFVGVMYFHLDPLDGGRLGVAADLSRVQLNVRLWATDELARNLQDLYSQLIEALHVEPVKTEAARALLAELNRLFEV